MEKADQAICIIYRLMSENISHIIEPYTADPAAAWSQLKERFRKNTSSNIGWLRRQFAALKFNSFKSTMADHLEHVQQLAHDIGQAERPLLPSELATAMLQSMPSNFTPTVQGIEAADKGTDPVYVYTKLIDEEQRQKAEKPQSGSNNKSDSALNASHYQDSKTGDKWKCFNCNQRGYFTKDCRSNKKNNNSRNNSKNNSSSNDFNNNKNN